VVNFSTQVAVEFQDYSGLLKYSKSIKWRSTRPFST